MLLRSLALLGVAAVLVAAGAARAAPASPAATLPVDGEIVRRIDPPAHRYGSGHRGVDVAARPGAAVRAALAGTVAFSGEVAGVGWVTLAHGQGLETTYGPVEPRAVRRGDEVAQGDVLGRVAQGAWQLDWGARRDGQYVDPESLLARWEAHLVHPDAPVPRSLADAAQSGGGPLLAPVAGPVTSPFGLRAHPILDTTRLHAGLDFAAPAGAPVFAAAPGVVAVAGSSGGYGLLVTVDHGGFETRYAHLSRVDVVPGQSVQAREQLGAVGSTGLSTGPHLHFEVRVGGVAQDPAPWLS